MPWEAFSFPLAKSCVMGATRAEGAAGRAPNMKKRESYVLRWSQRRDREVKRVDVMKVNYCCGRKLLAG